MKTKHTETPWRIGQSTNGEIAIRIGDGTLDDDCVAVVCDLLEGEADANAQFIVLACNHHEELVAILSELIEEMDTKKLTPHFATDWKARSLLTKLKG